MSERRPDGSATDRQILGTLSGADTVKLLRAALFVITPRKETQNG